MDIKKLANVIECLALFKVIGQTWKNVTESKKMHSHEKNKKSKMFRVICYS